MPVRHVFTSPQPDVADPTLVRPSNWNDTHAITLVEGVTIQGNTVGVGALISSGTLVLEGGNNVTLSQALGGNTILISAGAVGGGNFTAGVSTGGNTSGDTGVITGRLVLVGGNNVTLSQATAAGGLATVTISGVTQSTHAHTDAFNILSAGTQIAGTQQTVVFSDSNGLAFGMSNNSIITGSYTQSTHPHTDVFNRISAGTQIAGTQQTVIFSDSNGVAFGMSNNSVVTASYSQSTHAHTDVFNRIAAGTQTAGTQATVIFSDSNGVAFGMSNSSIVTASYSQSTHAHSDLSAGMSTQGNTSGTTGLVAAQLILVGGDNITLSQSVNGQSATLTISGGAGAGGNTLSEWRNYINIGSSNNQQSNTLVSICNFILPVHVAYSNVMVPVLMTVATNNNNSTAYVDISLTGVLYTRTGSTLSALHSFSSTYTQTWSSNNTSLVIGNVALFGTQAGATLTPGVYWMALHLSTTNSATGGANTTALGNTITVMQAGSIATGLITIRALSAGSANTNLLYSGFGMLSTNATRDSIAFSDYSGHQTRGNLANIAFALRNETYML